MIDKELQFILRREVFFNSIRNTARLPEFPRWPAVFLWSYGNAKDRLLVLVTFCVLQISTFAQDTVIDKSRPIFGDELSGNWGGFRDTLKAKGISFQPRLSLWGQGFVAGKGEKAFRVSGKADILFRVNGTLVKLPRWTLVVHLEQNFGRTVNAFGGTFIPVNTAPMFPGLKGSNAFDMSSFYLEYRYGKRNNLLMLGKINMLDMSAAARFTGGSGIDAFWNTAFCAPATGITPPYLFGAMTIVNTDFARYTLMAFDPTSMVNRNGWETPFEKGITASASAAKEFVIGGKKGTHTLRFTYSTQDGTDLYSFGDIFLPVPDTVLGLKRIRYYGSYNFNHSLVTYDEKGRGWGLIGLIGISDGNPNPIDFAMNLGIGGNSFLSGRRDDRWGLAWYYYSLSRAIDELAKPVRPLQDEKGIELFYEAKVYHGVHIGADLQWIFPIVKEYPLALFIGLRAGVKF